MCSIPPHYSVSLFEDGLCLEGFSFEEFKLLLTFLCMISQEAATEASKSCVLYVQLTKGHLNTGMVDSI